MLASRSPSSSSLLLPLLMFAWGTGAPVACKVETTSSDADAGSAGVGGSGDPGTAGGTEGSGEAGEGTQAAGSGDGGSDGSAGNDALGGEAAEGGSTSAAAGSGGAPLEAGATGMEAGAAGAGEEPDEGGFIQAFVRGTGHERLLAGPDLNPDFGWPVPEGFTVSDLVFDLRNRSFALSGFGTRVWFRILQVNPEEGVPRAQLFVVDTETGTVTPSPLPGEDLSGGLYLVTNEAGSLCFANNAQTGHVYRAQVGEAAEESFDYTGILDFEGNFGISDDGQQMFIGNLGRFAGDPAIFIVDLGSTPILPIEHVPNSELALDGVAPRSLANGEFDVAGDRARYVFRTNHDSTSLDPRTQDVLYLGDGFTSSTITEMAREPVASSPRDLQISDDGNRVGYCEEGEGVNGENRCLIRDLADDLAYEVGDDRSRVGAFVLSDDGTVAYFRTDICCDNGWGILQSVEGGQRRPAGTRTFFNTTGWTNAQLSDNGSTLVATVGDYLYLLRDSAQAPPALPDVTRLYYRFNDDCTLSLWVNTRDLPLEGRVFVDAYVHGVEPTAIIPGEDNPFFSIRNRAELSLVEGATEAWEATVALTNDAGQCAEDALTEEYRLRAVAWDPSKGATGFKDFSLD